MLTMQFGVCTVCHRSCCYADGERPDVVVCSDCDSVVDLRSKLIVFLSSSQRFANFNADVFALLGALPNKSVGMVFGSPPYEGQRSYGGKSNGLTGEKWVEWMTEVYVAAERVCTGVVGFVVQGSAESSGVWSAVPMLLAADLKRAGFNVWCPPLYKRYGIPGSGGKQRWRCDYEYVICVSPPVLPFAEPTACGKAPKFGRGGAMSNRTKSDKRVSYGKSCGLPKTVNPGNVIDVGAVGGGNMGGALAHENEAPFPVELPRRFVASFLAPDDVLVDPFCGSGTSQAAALSEGRRAVGGDIRAGQVFTADKRCQAYA